MQRESNGLQREFLEATSTAPATFATHYITHYARVQYVYCFGKLLGTPPPANRRLRKIGQLFQY